MTAPPGIERVLFTEEQVDQRIREVAAEISGLDTARLDELLNAASRPESPHS